MKTYYLQFISALLVMLMCSCSMFGPGQSDGRLTRRYRKADSVYVAYPLVDVQAYAFSVEPEGAGSPPGFFDQSDTVKIALISAFAKKDTSSGQLIQSIATPLVRKKAPSPDPYIDDRMDAAFKKKIIFSVRNNSYFPEDRIWKMTLNLTLNDPDIGFKTSSVLATDFTTVDVGKLSYNTKTTVGGNLSASTGAETSSGKKIVKDDSESSVSTTLGNKAGASAEYAREFTENEEVQLKQRFVKLTGSVNANRLSVYQESTSGIDLSGNVSAEIELYSRGGRNKAQTIFEFQDLKNGSRFSEPDKITVKTFVVAYPDPGKDIYGKLTVDAVIRKVYKNGKTISESDDKVHFAGNKIVYADSILILPQRACKPLFWQIGLSSDQPVRIDGLTNRIDLLFRAQEDAESFLVWLTNQSEAVVTGRCRLAKRYTLLGSEENGELKVSDIHRLKVFIVR